MSQLLVVGSLVVDTVAKVERLPRPGETVFVTSREQFLGGKGANQAVAAARMGAKVDFIGALCAGDFESEYEALFAKEGISSVGVMRLSEGSTGNASIWVGPDGLNMIAVDPGANMQLTGDWVRSHQGDHPLVLAQLETSDEALLALSCDKLILNPAPMRVVPPGLLERTWLITPNETETSQLTGIEPNTPGACESAALALAAYGISQVVITLGAKGVYHWDGLSGHHEPAPLVDAVDTTAAGDVFNGALAALIGSGLEVREALPQAVAFASLSTTKLGALASIPFRDELLP
ncbi:MAG: ribokinase [Fimbriimonadaceae bacterium]|jgi:ribokinase|nr:ribokinase [Fimbriimonadaceae bacterium]